MDMPQTDVWDTLASVPGGSANNEVRQHLAIAALRDNSQRWGVGALADPHRFAADPNEVADLAADCAIEIAAAQELLDPALLAADQAACRELQQMIRSRTPGSTWLRSPLGTPRCGATWLTATPAHFCRSLGGGW